MSMPSFLNAELTRVEVTPSSLARRLLLRFVFEAVAVALVVLAFPLLFGLFTTIGFAFGMAIFVGAITGQANFYKLGYGALFNAMRRVRRLGRRYSAMRYTTVEARQRLLQDTRPPILYLRSFLEEVPDNPLRTDLRTDEELLDHVLKEVGPTVAIGRPGEKLPPLGASRFYVEDSGWEQVVKDLIGRAQLVVIKPGVAHNLAWEIETAAGLAGPEKILFPLLDQTIRSPRFYKAFRDVIQDKMGVGLPEEIGRAIFLYFDAGWGPHFVTPDEKAGRDLNALSAYHVRESLRPLLESRGARFGRWTRVRDYWAMRLPPVLFKVLVVVTAALWLVNGLYSKLQQLLDMQPGRYTGG